MPRCSKLSRRLSIIVLIWISSVRADVSHFYATPEFASYPYQLPNLYGVPAIPVTPAPVAPVAAAATTEFSLPEIIENRSVKNHGNFIPLNQHYLPPSEERPNYESPQPPLGEEGFAGYYYPSPSSSTTTRRPIVVQDPGDDDLELQQPAGYDYHAPQPPAPALPAPPAPPIVVPPRPSTSTPAPVYLPPELPSHETHDHHLEQQQPLRLRVKEMRCLQGGYFRTVLKVDSFLGAAPSVDNDSYDKRCEPKLTRSYVLLDIAAGDFDRCGVRTCGQDLCIRLRFPTIRGLRTANDAILTLHCKTQERVAIKTHALKMGVANDVQARSSGSYAHGGVQNAFRTHVELLRRGSNGYTRHLDNNGAVQLGEELLLRAHVLAGDGWNYTKISDVQLQRIGASGELLNSAQLITARGCLNPAMQAVCAHAPSFEPPLGQRLPFKAVMFQGMRSGDVLVMSMRITGCLERDDCQPIAQDCAAIAAGQRRRRDAAAAGHNDTAVSELSQITFRVMMPDSMQESNSSADQLASTSKSFALYGSLGFVVLLLGVAFAAAYKLGR